MDQFWNKVFQNQAADQWNVRGKTIEEKVKAKVAGKSGSSEPVRCLELGTYCGYSALRIARNLPEGSYLVSVEKDELFAAIATKIVEFAGFYRTHALKLPGKTTGIVHILISGQH
eukprot:1303332-Amphidinium_carterae.2